MGRKTDEQKEIEDDEYVRPVNAKREQTYGKRTSVARKDLDANLARMVLDARQTLEHGGTVTFDFGRRKAVLTIKYQDTSALDDYTAD